MAGRQVTHETAEPKYAANGRCQHITPEERAEWRALIGKPGHVWSRHTVRDLLDVLEATEAKMSEARARILNLSSEVKYLRREAARDAR
jgi:phenylalanine-4-hydroxylase